MSRVRQQMRAEERRREVVKLTAEDVTVRDQARELGVHRNTIVRDRKFLMNQMREQNLSEIDAWRHEQLAELDQLRETLKSKTVSDSRKVELTLQILDREIKLLGTAAPSKAIVGHVSAHSDPRYLEFKKHADGLTDEQIEKVFAFMDAIERPKTVMDASWFPPLKRLESAS